MTQQMCDDAEAGLEFFPLPIWDMGTVSDSNNNKANLATAAYLYDDKTSVFRVPGKVWEPSTELAFSGVAPRQVSGIVDSTTPANAVGRCGEDLSDPYGPKVHHALHLAGGPFQEWGGGLGRMLKCMNTDSTDSTKLPWLGSMNLNKYLCGGRSTTAINIDPNLQFKNAACNSALTKPSDRTPLQQTLIGVCPQRDLNYAKSGYKVPDTDDPFLTGMALDLSDHKMQDPSGGAPVDVRGWEGIAFWARRSPNSQPGIRVAVADKYVDDDMSYLSMKYDMNRPRYCERKIVCNCQNNKPCTPVKVVDNVFDADGNRVKWSVDNSGKSPNKDSAGTRIRIAVDGLPMYSIQSDADLQEIRRNRHSLIDMSGTTVVDPATGKQKAFDDGSIVSQYNGVTGSGQPFDTDLMVPRTETFCFDPKADPVPPDGTPLSQIMNRSFQNNRVAAPDPPTYVMDPATGFFFNSTPPNPSLFSPPGSAAQSTNLQLPVTDPNHTEQVGYNYTPCGKSFCDFEYAGFQAVDPQAFGRTCTPFSFVGSITYSYCYNQGVDPNPPEATQQCGDYWMKSVYLTTDWQLIEVPFSSLIQQGWAKRQYQFDLKNLTDIRFEWDRGWLDVWISDVRFYRTKQ